MKKKLVSLFMALVCLCSVFFGAQAATPFTDVPSTAWYYDAVNYVYTMGLMEPAPHSSAPKILLHGKWLLPCWEDWRRKPEKP